MEMSIEKIDRGPSFGRVDPRQFFAAMKSLRKPQISATDFWGFVYFCPKKKTPGWYSPERPYLVFTPFNQALQKPPGRAIPPEGPSPYPHPRSPRLAKPWQSDLLSAVLRP